MKARNKNAGRAALAADHRDGERDHGPGLNRRRGKRVGQRDYEPGDAGERGAEAVGDDINLPDIYSEELRGLPVGIGRGDRLADEREVQEGVQRRHRHESQAVATTFTTGSRTPPSVMTASE